MRFVSLVVLALMLVILPSGVASVKAQESTVPENDFSSADSLTKQLDALNAQRRDALKKLLQLEREMFDLRQDHINLQTYVRGNFGEENYKRAIKILNKIKEETATEEDLNFLSNAGYDSNPVRVDTTIANVEKHMAEELRETSRFHQVGTDIKAKQNEAILAEESAERIEDELERVIKAADEKNKFRQLVSMMFTGLVALVIAGFYFMAFKIDVVANAFGGEKGIQFITLFLVVIAIILFGIMGVFGGKELSALLGAISGYILGRSNFGASADKPKTTPETGGETKAT